MNQFSKYLKSFTLITLLTPFLLAADQAEHLPVGVRQMSPESSDETAPDQETANYTLQEDGKSGFIYDRYTPTYYPNEYHWLIQAIDDRLELEDGSVWKLNSYDVYKTKKWWMKDTVTITQNHRWFSSYTYKIINKNTGTSVEANLFLGPIKDGEYTRYIASVDTSRGQITLTDNTNWEVSSGDAYIFRDWALSDAIIIGSNSGWDSKCEAILINVTMNNFVRAKQF